MVRVLSTTGVLVEFQKTFRKVRTTGKQAL
jgi:hypothetical protein